MAILRYDIPDDLQVQAIDTPEKGEKLLSEALSNLEEYSKSLIKSHSNILQELKSRVSKTSEVATLSLEESMKTITKFDVFAKEKMIQLDELMENVDGLMEDIKAIDFLYDDVLKLSKLLYSLEQFMIKQPS